jgi:protein O-GlcNAc transferase
LELIRLKRPNKPSQATPPRADIPILEQLLKNGRVAEAEALARSMLQHYPQAAEAWRCLGIACLAQRRYADAVEPLKHSLILPVGQAETWFNLGFALEQISRLDEAIAAYGAALGIKPDLLAACERRGNLLLRLQQPAEALAAFLHAQQFAPGVATIRVSVGNALGQMGRLDEAAQAYRAAIGLKPDLADAYAGLGHALASLERWEEALESCRAALAFLPEDMGLLSNLGTVLLMLRRPAEAVEIFREVLRRGTSVAGIYRNYAQALSDMGLLDEAVAAYRRVLELQPDDLGARSGMIFLLNYLESSSPEEILSEAKRYGTHVARRAEPTHAHANPPDPERPLRVGLVSGDFGSHPVGAFLLGVLSNLDPARLELFTYETLLRQGEVNARLRCLIPHWRDARATALDDQTFAMQIDADRIDILIDLSGHTGHNRLPVFGRKPAPVQVSWLGYPGTTGLDTMDYVLADPWALPSGDEAQFSEIPWRLPETYVCFTPPAVDIEVGTLPALASNQVTFGSFNNLNKLTDRVLACWSAILHAVPGSQLYLKNRQLGTADVRAAVEARFARHGIESGQLILEGPLDSMEEHMRAYRRMDMALDPFPYSGTTTTVEALWMGVPVLSMRGHRFLSHQGETLLHNAGLTPWIASDESEYVAKATAFASDLALLSALRERLREQLAASPLCDAPRFACNLEQALRQMWRIWCAKQNGGAAGAT